MNTSINVSTQSRYFLVSTDCMALVIRPKKKANDFDKEKELIVGTVVKECVTDRHERSKAIHRHRTLLVMVADHDVSTNEVYCVDLKNLAPVAEEDAFLLLSVLRPRERIAFYLNKDLMNEAKSIKEGMHVYIDLDDSEDATYLRGVVFKKGLFSGYPGTQFAIKLFDNNWTKDDYDCNNLVTFPFHKLRLIKNQGCPADNTISISAKLHQLTPNSTQVDSAKSKNDCNFHLNERVGWLSEKGVWEYGVVKFLGALPGQTDIHVGVEFDNAVGTGDGRYQSKFLFSSPPKHAAFIPIEQLKKRKDMPAQSSKSGSTFKFLNKSKKKKDSDSTKLTGTSTFYDEKASIVKDDKFSKPFREYSEKTIVSSAPITFDIAKQFVKDEECLKIETKSASASPKSRKESSPSPPDVKDETCAQRSPSNSPYSARVQVTRFPTAEQSSSTVQSTRFPTPPESSSPALNQEKRFSNEQVFSGRSTSTSKLSSMNQQQTPKVTNKTIPSPTQHKRNSSALENAELRMRSTQSSERNVKSDLPIINLSYDERTKKGEFWNDKTKEEKKIELWSDKVKNGKTKSIENVNVKPENGTSKKSEYSSSHRSCLKSPESPDVNDYYHVVKDECLPTEPKDTNIPFYDDFDKFLSLTDCSVTEKEVEQSEFGVGSVVEVTIIGQPWYGVIRWIGKIEEDKPKVAGLEMDDTHEAFCEGELNGARYFKCPYQKGFFVYLHLCRKDSRFMDSLQVNINEGNIPPAFGSKDCPVVTGEIPPLSYSEYVFQNLFGKNKGIQGHHNSCYLDATLFSMFAFTPVFDDLLNRPPQREDIDSYSTVQRVLKEEIVNPLRRNMYVRADRVMGLRKLLDKLSSVSGLTSEEKDPEEFLNSLLHQILKAEPYLKLSSGQEAFFYQLFIEKNDSLRVPTVQQLFDQSFLTSDIKLKEIPSCLIIQMPRHGKQFKMYNRIFPSPILDITDVLEDTPRECCVCGILAQFECRDCFYCLHPPFTLKAFCTHCSRTTHQHLDRSDHKPRKIKIMDQFRELTHMTRVTMELFAVVCIETSHYVSFSKCGNEADVPWCFFDSMADRRGEQNGYNIPEIVLCRDLSDWLTDDGSKELEKDPERQLPEMPKRLFGDAYLCMYQNSSVMMYH